MKHKRIYLAIAAAALAAPITVGAQDRLGLEEIIVTAERRSTDLQSTPASITAITGAAIESVGMNNLNELTLTTPGITLSGINRHQQYVAMRGNVTRTGVAGSAQSIGFFVDGLYYGRSSLFNQNLSDVERVEILRGPQGTLWGHNIVGGSINVITKDPTQETEADLKVSIGNYDRLEVSGRVAGGLTETLAGQLSFSTESADGYVTNLDSGQDLGAEDAQLVRGKLVWDVTDRLTAKLSGTYQVDTSGMNARNYFPAPVANITPPPPGTTAPVLHSFSVPDDFEENTYMGSGFGDNDDDVKILSLDLQYDIGHGITFRSLTGVVDSYGEVNNFSFFPIPASHGHLRRDYIYEDESFSQEFHLSGGADSTLFWQVGAYYYDSDNVQKFNTSQSGLPFTRAGSSNFADAQGDQNGSVEFYTEDAAYTESLALFGQTTWAITDWLDLTTGVRHTEVDKTAKPFLEGEASPRNFTEPGVDCTASVPVTCRFDREVSDSWTNTSPRVTLDGHWDSVGFLDSLMVYATYSEGWKEGGFELPGSSIEPVRAFAITPESAENREIGFKTTFWDNRARFNAAIFNTEYSGQQTTVDVNQVLRTFNLDSEIDGVEIDGSLALTDWLTMHYSAAFYDAEYLPGAAIGPNPQDSVAGNETIATPDTSYTVGWDAATYLDNGVELFFTGSYAYSSEQEADPGNPLHAADAAGRDLLKYTESEMLSASLGIRKDNWEISLWGRNLLDDYVLTDPANFAGYWVLNAWDADVPSMAVFEGTRTEPRTYGLAVKWTLN